MRWIRLTVALVVGAPSIGIAQSGSAAPAGVAAQDTTQPAPKKSGGLFHKKAGLFGKMKGLAESKVVNSVAKTALCTAVPGGSLVASALDAKKAKSKGATGAAVSAATGSTGSCMPGMGLAGMGLAGKAGAAASVAGALPGVGVPGLPTTGVQGAALSAAQLNQTGGGPGAMTVTAEQLNQMEEQYRKMGMKPEQIKAMEAQIQAMQPAGSPGLPEPQASTAIPATAVASPAPATVGQPRLSNEAGNLVVRGLPWMPATAVIRPDAQSSFSLAMRDLASTVHQSRKHYKVVARVEDQGKKALTRKLSQQRAAAVVAGLVAEGITATEVKAVEGGADKDARILLQETK
jgi:hypothetical protein